MQSFVVRRGLGGGGFDQRDAAEDDGGGQGHAPVERFVEQQPAEQFTQAMNGLEDETSYNEKDLQEKWR